MNEVLATTIQSLGTAFNVEIPSLSSKMDKTSTSSLMAQIRSTCTAFLPAIHHPSTPSVAFPTPLYYPLMSTLSLHRTPSSPAPKPQISKPASLPGMAIYPYAILANESTSPALFLVPGTKNQNQHHHLRERSIRTRSRRTYPTHLPTVPEAPPPRPTDHLAHQPHRLKSLPSSLRIPHLRPIVGS